MEAKRPFARSGRALASAAGSARLRLSYNDVMSRITRLDKDQVDPETGKIYDLYLQERGNVPNMFRTVAHRPEIFRTMIAHFRAVMKTGTVPAKLKELVIVRTSQINRCEY